MAEPSKYRKLYPKDLLSSGIQRNLNKYTRIGKISKVDSERGTCTIQWLDRPGFSVDVFLAQGSHKEWSIPEKEAVVLVAFDVKEQPRIIRYVNVGHAKRVGEKSLPKLKEGEKLWECAGSFIYMKRSGDILLWSQSEGIVALENSSGTFRSETVNWKVQTAVGSTFLGVISRLVDTAFGTKEIQVIKDANENSLAEYKFKLYQTAEEQDSITGTPLIELVFGTVVNEDGEQVDKDGEVVINPDNALFLQMIVTRNGTQLLKASFDKSGRFFLSSIGDYAINLTQKLLVTAQEVVLNGGTKGVARLDDAVQVTLNPGTYANMTAGGSPLVVGSAQTIDGAITEASETVKAGN